MDLIAPNPAIMQTGFIQLGIIVTMVVVSQIKLNSADRGVLLWAKMNAPLVSVLLSVAWAMISYAAFRPAPALDDYFVAGIWMAGGTSLVSAIVKDVRDGSYKATDELDVIAMRRNNPKHGGIGS
jgi:multisubunit Na+/H+ antiporter MnhB subunit